MLLLSSSCGVVGCGRCACCLSELITSIRVCWSSRVLLAIGHGRLSTSTVVVGAALAASSGELCVINAHVRAAIQIQCRCSAGKLVPYQRYTWIHPQPHGMPAAPPSPKRRAARLARQRSCISRPLQQPPHFRCVASCVAGYKALPVALPSGLSALQSDLFYE